MTDILVPGARDVRGTLEEPEGETDAIVVACPPHPQHGGSRSNGRLVAVADALTDLGSRSDADPPVESGIACLRFDYGDWDEGDGERIDVRNAVRWAAERYDRVGLFGYSFGATLSLVVASELEAVDAVAALAPTARLAEDLDAVAALDALSPSRPVQVLYGERDETVDWEPVVERATDRGDDVVSIPADHFFVGQDRKIADGVSGFFASALVE
ncbi:alpha/beta hydrolase [Halobiforma lacisalsi AJ5]|uniref:Alpha/beta hydrolase n=1 Tax=Natronobacterium lacisalsi AJ5 TaxID=358396 RepID=M0LEZ0_NATLA|nr:dienelactone hydrolase family protein [Halobiforma lacisalsi]APW96602.1 alpha/beta hydrolase [Halobiforma lacisalsi AJ5]EMA32116.1 hydrolase of the alpha/beta superfamily-like protein [Halobiforma lacisalsi AJ5]